MRTQDDDTSVPCQDALVNNLLSLSQRYQFPKPDTCHSASSCHNLVVVEAALLTSHPLCFILKTRPTVDMNLQRSAFNVKLRKTGASAVEFSRV